MTTFGRGTEGIIGHCSGIGCPSISEGDAFMKDLHLYYHHAIANGIIHTRDRMYVTTIHTDYRQRVGRIRAGPPWMGHPQRRVEKGKGGGGGGGRW